MSISNDNKTTMSAIYTNTDDSEVISNITASTEQIDWKGVHYSFTGFAIFTNKQQINVMISSGTTCCESYGIEAQVNNNKVMITDIKSCDELTSLKNALIGQSIKSIMFLPDIKNYDGIVCTIPIIVKLNGEHDLKLMIHNDHNGYYPHSYFVQWGAYSDIDSI